MIYFLTVNYNSAALIIRLIDSLSLNKGITYQLIVINNSPQDKKIYNLENDRVHIIEAEKNLGFARACNLGLNSIYQQNPQALVWLINPDAYLTSSNLEQVPRFFSQHHHLSILGTTIYTPTGEIWFAGGAFSLESGAIVTINSLDKSTEKDYWESDWVSGCSLLINFKNFDYCPQFDGSYFLYYEDFDFCRRYALMGHQIAVSDRFSVMHEPSSIANRNQINKIRHSTYSYLLTLQRYTCPKIFWLRFVRLLVHALIIVPVKPQLALGKIIGIYKYFTQNFYLE